LDGRILVEIVKWDVSLHVGLSSEATPPEQRFQGGLSFVRGIELDGRIVAPESLRGKSIRVWHSTFGTELRFGEDGLDEVGQLWTHSPQSGRADLTCTLLLPESSLPLAVVALGAVWKYLRIWTFDEEDHHASIRARCLPRSA